MIGDPCWPSLPHIPQVPLPHLQLEAAPREGCRRTGGQVGVPGSIVPLRWPAASPSTSQAMPSCLVQLQVWPKVHSLKRESWSRSEGGVGRKTGHLIQLTHELIHPLYPLSDPYYY